MVGRDGEYRGTATLVDGILHVVTTADDEDIQIGTTDDHDIISVAAIRYSDIPSSDYSRVRGVLIDRSRLRGIVVDAGDGNDGIYFSNSNGLVNLPVTMNGGAGDDDLYGENDRLGGIDVPIAFRSQQATYAHMVLNGGDGNDRLDARIGDTTLIGGAGNDTIFADVDYDTWGHNTVIDDPPAALAPVEPVTMTPPAAPADAKEPAARPATKAEGDTPPATNPAAVPPPFSTAAVPLTSTSVFGHHADDLWDAAA